MKKLGFFVLLGTLFFGGAFYWYQARETKPEAISTAHLEGYEIATFAGGCFWCIEAGFEKVPGVKEAISGYSGGEEKNPTYRDVGYGLTGHTEVVQVYYNAKLITYEGLVEAFWRMMDPTDNTGQFKDRGRQYRPAIYYRNDAEKTIAEKSRENLATNGPFKKPIKTEITKLGAFYPAESYHQNYYKKNPVRYKLYTHGSGRADFVVASWGDKLRVDFKKYKPSTNRFNRPNDKDIKERLTPLQYKVTQHEGTEAPFKNEFWNDKRKGIYVDIVSGEPLFSSRDKFKSGTGWPSFTKPIRNSSIVEKTDRTLFVSRIEVRSEIANSHLGHVFNDGPAPTGKRYCVNSASLRFIPAGELATNGYGEYTNMFSMKGM